MLNDVLIIGAGLSGLAAACHLTGRGYAVTVVERAEVPGGRAGVLVKDGFTFDTGPTVLTMPDLIADALRAVGADLDMLPMRRLDPAYRACFADGSTIMVRSGRDAMRDEIDRTCGSVDAAAFDGFVDWLQRLYAVEMPHFIDANYDSPLGLLRSPRAVAQLLRLNAFGRLGAAVRRRFTDPRLHRLFSFQAMYAGLAPDDALALYAVITYMDSINGVYFPEGGMHALPTALARAAEKAGVTFCYGDAVTSIVLSPVGRVAGVQTASGNKIAADAVICTLDLPTAYATLLSDLRPPRAAVSGSYSPSAVVWHVGVRGVPDGASRAGSTQPPIAHHNIHFGNQWAQAFDDLLKRGTLMRDPSRLVTVPSLDEPAAAPSGSSTLYVLEPVPNLSGKINWRTEAGPMRERLHAFLAQQGYPSDVAVEEMITPLDWETQGMAAWYSIRARSHLRSDRPVPAGKCRAPAARDVLRRVGHGARGGRTDGVDLGQAGRRSSGGLPGMINKSVLRKGYRRCARLTWQYGTTYFWGAILLPRRRRKHVHAIYALCRLADDIVDDQQTGTVRDPAGAARRLQAFADRFRTALIDRRSDDPTMAAIVHTVITCGIEPECFERFFGAMEMDLTRSAYETWEDLCGYMEGSAAVIGEMMLPVLEPTSPAAYAPARSLGLAFQLTNFLRDIDEDLERARVYVPQVDLRRFGVNLRERRVTDEFKEFLAYQIDRNRALYTNADVGIALLPPRSARCVGTARVLYAQILDRIEAADYDVFSGRVGVPTWRKAMTAARIMVAGPRTPASQPDRARKHVTSDSH